MHRKLEAELLPLDIELEKTLRNLKKVRSAESAVMAEQREIQQNTQAHYYKGSTSTLCTSKPLIHRVSASAS